MQNECEFGGETTPVSAYVIGNIGGIVSRSAAAKTGRQVNEALWDDAPALRSPTHNKIYNPGGELPDCAAQALFDAGMIKDPYPTTMWHAIQVESDTAVRVIRTKAVSLKAERQSLQVSKFASMLGRMGKGKKKTMSQAMIDQRKAAGKASGIARAINSSQPF
jgi:hypothetical protein